MELQIKEMMAEGIIQRSNNAFSSPVLLVRKKDGSWRFYVDYIALNVITITNQFSIPSIEELIDERTKQINMIFFSVSNCISLVVYNFFIP